MNEKLKKFQIIVGDIPILTIDDEDIYNFKKFLFKMCLELSKSNTIRNTIEEFNKYSPIIANMIKLINQKEKNQ